MKKDEQKITCPSWYRREGNIKVWSMRNAVLAVALLIILQSLFSPKTLKGNEGNILSELYQIKSGLVEYGKDINEMREYLLLEPKDYKVFENDDFNLNETESATNKINQFTQTLGEDYSLQKQQEKGENEMNNLKKNQNFYKEIRAIELWPARYLEKNSETITYKFYEGKNAIAQLILNKSDGVFKMQSIIGVEEIKYSEEKPLEQCILEYIQNKKTLISEIKLKLESQKIEMSKLWENEEINKTLSENLLQANLNPTETEKGWEYSIQNVDSQPLLIITINRANGSFVLNNSEYENIELFTPPFLELLKKLDGKTDRIKQIELKKKEVQKLINSEEFKISLNQNNLEVMDGREDGNRIYYDLKNIEDEEIIGSIILETETGNIIFDNPLENVKKNS